MAVHLFFAVIVIVILRQKSDRCPLTEMGAPSSTKKWDSRFRIPAWVPVGVGKTNANAFSRKWWLHFNPPLVFFVQLPLPNWHKNFAPNRCLGTYLTASSPQMTTVLTIAWLSDAEVSRLFEKLKKNVWTMMLMLKLSAWLKKLKNQNNSFSFCFWFWVLYSLDSPGRDF